MARPYFLRPDYEDVLEDAKQEERDFRALQAMYPEAAKLLLPYIEDECDQMEYEGSMMFDEYPDQVSVRRIGQRIEQQTQGLFPEGSTKVQEQMPEELFSMQHSGPGRNRPGQNWLGDLIHVMLLQEMHHRRCRHRRCRNHL